MLRTVGHDKCDDVPLAHTAPIQSSLRLAYRVPKLAVGEGAAKEVNCYTFGKVTGRLEQERIHCSRHGSNLCGYSRCVMRTLRR